MLISVKAKKIYLYRCLKISFKACFFSLSIITTIGYGNVATKTIGGRVFCLLFGIVGIPFMLSVLADVGGLLAGVMQVRETSLKFRVSQEFILYTKYSCNLLKGDLGK